jgi:hypothetical protein
MHQIDNPWSTGVKPVAQPVGMPGWFQKGNPPDTLATIVDYDWANTIQGEILNVVVNGGGLVPDKQDDTQLLQAIQKMIDGITGVDLSMFVLKAGDTMTGPLITPKLTSNTGRIISENSGNNPSVIAYDISGGFAGGFWSNAPNGLVFGSTDGSGVPGAAWFIANGSGLHALLGLQVTGSVNASGNLAVSGQISAGTNLFGHTTYPCYPTAPTFYLNADGANNVINFQTGYAFVWNTSNGTLSYVANSATAMSIDYVGNLVASGNVTANNGRLRAGYGAFQSGDPNAATILNDHTLAPLGGSYVGPNNYYYRAPNGFIIMMWYDAVEGQTFQQVRWLPFQFPNICLGVTVQVGSVIVSSEGVAFGANPINAAQYQITNAGQVSSGPYGVFLVAYGF